MNHADFEKLFDEVVAQERETMITKAQDYAGGTDRLWNFHAGSNFTGLTPAETLWGYLSKHLASVRDIARGKRVTRETLREKCGDARNYILLLEALVLTHGVREPKQMYSIDAVKDLEQTMRENQYRYAKMKKKDA